MMAKFVNMSIVAVWQMNALGLFVVMDGGASSQRGRCHNERLGARRYLRGRSWGGDARAGGALAATSTDSRNPTDYGLQSWLKYPALALAPFRSATGCTDLKCLANLPAPRSGADSGPPSRASGGNCWRPLRLDLPD